MIFSTRTLALGDTIPMIGRLLGHTQVEITARYAHLAKESLRGSAVRISDSIARDLVFRVVAAWRVPRVDGLGRGADCSGPALAIGQGGTGTA